MGRVPVRMQVLRMLPISAERGRAAALVVLMGVHQGGFRYAQTLAVSAGRHTLCATVGRSS